ncbi:unnamed protein product [Adineta steineri]|uniref:Dynein light chain 1, cytoplasmic n=1 Tax=Adineta steineri TaxID=433720 RepID=A0A815C4Y7_9BILA|nr:unnamed protein product [Adineta steineri]CAF1279243.1 unnamed protein product [Adineta steineri]CAF1459947.1 unnamed protein product [Adineta steineri]
MYTSTYSSSPVRASTLETTPINYQTQTYHREQYHSSNNISNNGSNIMNDDNINLRRGVNGFGNSSSSLTSLPANTPTSARKYTHSYANQPTDPNRYQTTSYRGYGIENESIRPNTTRYDLSGNVRAYSYDNLYNEQNRSQPSVNNSRSNVRYAQQQQIKREPPYSDHYDDEEDDLIVKSTDLPAAQEQEMIILVRTAFRKYQITNQRELAGFLKRAADKTFTPCWHCIVGRQFSSYVTHEMNGFIYFTKGPLSILLFKSGA